MGTVFVVNQRIEGSDILKGLIKVIEKRRNLLNAELDVAAQIGKFFATVFG